MKYTVFESSEGQILGAVEQTDAHPESINNTAKAIHRSLGRDVIAKTITLESEDKDWGSIVSELHYRNNNNANEALSS